MNEHTLTLSEVITILQGFQAQLGDVRVFGGTLYQDFPVTGVVIEDGYPLILVSEEVTF